MADEQSSEQKPDVDKINLKVVTQDGNEIFFTCKMTTPLQKVGAQDFWQTGASQFPLQISFTCPLAARPSRIVCVSSESIANPPVPCGSSRQTLTFGLPLPVSSHILAQHAAHDGFLQPSGRRDELGALPL